MKKDKTAYWAVWAVLAVTFTAGCRYTIDGGLPERIRTVYVPVFRNRTTYRELESEVTRAVQDVVGSSSRLRLAGPAADAELLGEVSGVLRQVRDENTADVVVEGQIVIRARVRLIDRTGAAPRTLFDRVLSSQEMYLDSGVFRDDLGRSETAARTQAVNDLGKVIGRAVLDYWAGPEPRK